MSGFTDTVKTVSKTAWYWRVAVVKMFNGCVKVCILSFLSGTADRNWSDMSGDQHWVVLLTGFIAAQTVIETFCDTTMHDLRRDKGDSNPFAFVKTPTKIQE